MPATQPKNPDDEEDMAARIRAHDWSSTPLGPIAAWPAALRVALSLAEKSTYPTAIYAGADFRLIYNDAWAPVPLERHPWALGRPASEVWADIWHIIEPQFRQVVNDKTGFSVFNQMLPMVRNGIERETYWNYSFTPLIGDDGEVAGILNHGHEVTPTILAERRLSFQIELSDRLRELADPVDVKMSAVEMLGRKLDVNRAGYGQIDEGEQRVSVRRDWRRDENTITLAGESRLIDAFGKNAVGLLRAGETLIVHDCREDPRVRPEHLNTWESIGTRALIVVPLVKAGRLRAILYLHEAKPRRWHRWEADLARDVAERIWAAVERAETERQLRESEDHYRHAVELNPQVTWTAAPDGQLNRVSKRWFDWTGTTGLGDAWAGGLHPDDREPAFEAWARCVATGEIYDIEHRVQRLDGGYRWARSRAFPRRDDNGEIMLWYGTTEDIHERKVAEERQRLLINELNHRVKNTLATVQAIAFQTLKGDISLVEARRRFEGRLMALSRAHNMLTKQNWEGATLHCVLGDATAHLQGDRDRFELSGERIWIAPRAALALALALHELSTNAVKYGALSCEEGKVRVSWRQEGDKLRIEWKESDGPPLVEPSSRGFGSRLIERGLEADLGGSATMYFEPDGLRCLIEASREAIAAEEDANG
jgi:PAS domain S-box-containing protein